VPKNTEWLSICYFIRKIDVETERLLRTRSTFSQSLMVSVGVWKKFGCTSLIFIDPGVKINGDYYCNVLLSQQLLPAIRQISGEFIFHQDNAPAHRARETINLLERETPAFISPDLWPPNSLDLNPVDYKIWVIVQQRVYQTKVQDWLTCSSQQTVIDEAIDQWRKRLHSCIRVRGGCLEDALWIENHLK